MKNKLGSICRRHAAREAEACAARMRLAIAPRIALIVVLMRSLNFLTLLHAQIQS